MRWAAFRAIALTVSAVIFFSNQASAAEPSGSAVRVDTVTSADGITGARVLLTEGAIYAGDEITTNSSGLAQLIFVDNTRIVIGPNSRMVIDKFVFNPDRTAREVSLNAVRGVFRFISGNSNHKVYSIRTPTMTIGVRGTIVDINAGARISSAVFSAGAGTICSGPRNCVNVQTTCQYWIAQGGHVTQATGAMLQQVATRFPFLRNQGQLDFQFRTTANCQLASDTPFHRAGAESDPTDEAQPVTNTPPPPPPPPPPTEKDCEPSGESSSYSERGWKKKDENNEETSAFRGFSSASSDEDDQGSGRGFRRRGSDDEGGDRWRGRNRDRDDDDDTESSGPAAFTAQTESEQDNPVEDATESTQNESGAGAEAGPGEGDGSGSGDDDGSPSGDPGDGAPTE